MSIDDQAGLNAEPVEKIMNDLDNEQAEVISPGGSGFKLPSWVFIERLDEPVERYKSHPFNFGNSEGVAYIIRGFSALAGGVLNYWWTDVIGGFIRLRKESSEAVPVSRMPVPDSKGGEYTI